MQINKIDITNFQGLHHAALVVSDPLLLVSGGNGAGKSSLMDAIAMALEGKPRRVSLKKDLGQLITDGNKKGSVTVATSEGEFAIALPAGKGVQIVDQPFLPFVLDASRFAALDSKARRKVLFDLTGASAQPKVVAQRLTERGAVPDLIEKIKPLLLAGFPAAADQAKVFASEARGAWQQLTGENYGSEKAESWEPVVPDATASNEDVAEAEALLNQLNQDLAEASETLNACKAKASQAQNAAARITELSEQAELVERRAAKVKRDTEELQEWIDKRDAAKAASEGVKKGLIHEMAGAMQAFEDLAQTSDGYSTDGKVQPWAKCPVTTGIVQVLERYRAEHGPIGGDANAELAARLLEFQGYVDKLTTVLENSRRDLSQSENAVATIAELQKLTADTPTAEAIDNAQEQIEELRKQRDTANARAEALKDLLQVQRQHKTLTDQAAELHSKVQAWSLIADALSPAGIPSEILAAAIAPFNDTLRELANIAGWKEARINGDIDITYGERMYGLLSESEKWRADALFATAIAKLSGLRLVMLDRFDVLEPKARPQALKLLMTCISDGGIDQAVMAGTMKEPMAKLPAGIQQVWIENGITNQPAAAAA